MIAWLNSLPILGVVFFWLGVAATLLLLVQIVMMLFSVGDGVDADADFDGDGLSDSPDMGTGINIFTLKGLTAFFTISAWVGLLCVLVFPEKLMWLSLVPALIAGVAAMLLMAFAMKGVMKLQSSGNVVKENVIGRYATVYAAIFPARKGIGKITLTVQGQLREYSAVTDEEEKLEVNEQVEIVDLADGVATVRKRKKDAD